MAQRHRRDVDQLSMTASGELQSLWRNVDPDNIRDSWAEQVPRAAAVIGSGQLMAARSSESYTRNVLEEQGISPAGPRLNAEGFAGNTFPLGPRVGFPLEVAAMTPAFMALRYIGAGYDVERSLAAGMVNLVTKSQTAIADASRQAEGVTASSAEARVVQVRVVSPGACSRCIILAGRTYRDASFLRHPSCNCTAMPSDEASAAQYTTDPYAHFQGLSQDDQDRKFGKANAQAVRDGADIFQVVNAQREMYTTAGGSLATRAGTTRRGTFGRMEQQAGRTRDRRGAERYGSATRHRMVPEEIYKQAPGDRARQVELLEEYGFILPQGQVPTGAIRGFNDRSLARPSFTYRDGQWVDDAN